jgi:DDE superfamily endonuclease.
VKRPKAFIAAGIDPENLRCKWRSNKKAWMTGAIFKEWLFWFDGRMSGRKVVLLMDNFSAHEAVYAEIGQQLQDILIIWLPVNSTTRYQPLDQGIIRTWKAYWKRQWILYMMAEYDRGFNPISTMTILHALQWAIPASNIDLKSDTIRRCFKRALAIEDNKKLMRRN